MHRMYGIYWNFLLTFGLDLGKFLGKYTIDVGIYSLDFWGVIPIIWVLGFSCGMKNSLTRAQII